MKDKLNNNFVVCDKRYPLGKDIDGNFCYMDELHEVILSIILEFDRVCRKNNIPYALGFGGAIGLVNYGKIIPWDDDADIVVMYEDFPRLVEALKKDLSNEFSFDCYETNKRYYPIIPSMKIRKKGTYCLERNSLHLPNRSGCAGIFLDVVTFMGVPENEKEHQKLLKYAKRRMPLFVLFDSYLHINPIRMKNNLKKYEKEVAEKYKDSKMISQTIIIPFQNWTTTTQINKNAFPREIILPFKEETFAGHQLFFFQNSEEFVKLRYGENALKQLKDGIWVDNYPEDKRKSRHFKQFSLIREKK